MIRLLPSANVRQQTLTVNGRIYSGAPGVAIDVPDCDSAVLTSNGWIFVGRVATTTARPTAQRVGEMIVVPNLGLIIWDGAAWRSPVDGASQ
jgi:hypothetical protein